MKPSVASHHGLVIAAVTGAAIMTAAVAYLAFRGGDQTASASAAPVVGGDLHAVAVIDGRRFVSGHAGAGYSDTDGTWRSIPTLNGKDGMAWANIPGTILVGGHEGLYISRDNGATFAQPDTDLTVTDVHALGAAGQTVYLASPQGGLYVSTDGGTTFDRRSDTGASFMGTMIIDPDDQEHVIAPDMSSGAVESSDGGLTWRPLGGPPGAMSVAQDPRDPSRLMVTGMSAAALSSDGGQTWQPVDLPPGAAAAAFDQQGRLVAAVLVGDRAELYLSGDAGTSWTRI